jgi:uncharacterized protein
MIGSIGRRWKHYVLLYRYVEDMENKRLPFLEEHIKLSRSFEGKGLLFGGPMINPRDGAVVLWVGDEQVVKNFVEKDPYVKNKLVSFYEIREISFASGSLSLNL